MIAFEYHDPNKSDPPLNTLGFMLPVEHLSLRIDEAGIRAFDGRGLLAPVVLYSPTWIRETRNYTHRYGALIRGVWSRLMWDIAGYEANVLSKLEIAEVEAHLKRKFDETRRKIDVTSTHVIHAQQDDEAKLRDEIEAFEDDTSSFISQVDKEMGIDERA